MMLGGKSKLRSLSVARSESMKLFVLAMLCATLSGCASWTRSSAVTAEGVCAVWPITPYSKKDTPETIEGNRLNNARHEGFCSGI